MYAIESEFSRIASQSFGVSLGILTGGSGDDGGMCVLESVFFLDKQPKSWSVSWDIYRWRRRCWRKICLRKYVVLWNDDIKMSH